MKLSDTFKVTTPGELEIVMARDFDAPPDMIFDALTKPELVRRWLTGPDGWIMPVCEIDLKVGGAWRYVWRNEENGREFDMHGEYREIDRPARIVHTEFFGEGESLVTSSITTKVDTSTLTMTMRFASRAERDGALETGMADGVAVGYDRLDEILAPLPLENNWPCSRLRRLETENTSPAVSTTPCSLIFELRICRPDASPAVISLL